MEYLSGYTIVPTSTALQTLGELLFDAGNINGVTFGAGNTTLGGVISNGGAAFVLTGASSFTGSTTLSDGTLELANSSSAALGSTPGIAVNSA